MRKHVIVVMALLFSTAVAYGDSISRLAPSSINVGDVEGFVGIYGTGLVGSVSTLVVYSGSAGQFSVEPSVITADGTHLTVWIPVSVATTEGRWMIDVYATDATAVRHIGPAAFDVIQPVIQEPPLLGLPEVVVVEATDATGADVTFTATAIDFATGNSLPVTCNPISGSHFSIGTHSVTCSATNSVGTASGSFLVRVSDFTPPVLTVPADIVSENAVVTFTTSAVDNVDGAVSVSCTPASGSTFPTGTTKVACVAVDSSLNYGRATFLVTITAGAPLLDLPSDMEVEATGPTGAVVTYTATATGGTILCSPASGSTFPLGTTVVNCSATNANGTSTGSFNVTVVDTTPPALNLPSDITAEATSANGATVTFSATATDLVDGTVSVVCTPSSGSLFPFGVTAVDCSAADSRGNSVQGSFMVTVADTTPPSILEITATPNKLWPPDHKMVSITIAVNAIDAVDPAPVSRIVTVTSNQPINGTGDGDMSPDWNVTGPLTLDLRAERSGGSDRIYTITVETTDLYGNSILSQVTVTVMQTKSRAATH